MWLNLLLFLNLWFIFFWVLCFVYISVFVCILCYANWNQRASFEPNVKLPPLSSLILSSEFKTLRIAGRLGGGFVTKENLNIFFRTHCHCVCACGADRFRFIINTESYKYFSRCLSRDFLYMYIPKFSKNFASVVGAFL